MNTLADFASLVRWHWEWLAKLREYGCPAWKLEQVQAECDVFQWALHMLWYGDML